MWNLSFYFCLCITTKIFTVIGFNYFLRYFYFPFFLFLYFRKLHGKKSRTYQDTDSNESSNENEDQFSVKSIDLVLESTEPTTENSSNGRDKKAYLKSLERSLRTGRRIQDDGDDNNHENESQSNPFNFIRHCINKYIRRKITETQETTEL
jgi:hypothetical protein